MAKRLQNKIDKRKAIIVKALKEIAELTNGQPITPMFLNTSQYKMLMVDRVWTEDFIDEDTGEVVSIKRSEPCFVVRTENKGVQVI